MTNFLVAESGAEIVGSIGMEYVGGCALLRSAAVSAKHRGHGVARRLTEEIIARARSRGVESVYLLTTTAEAYFPKFGFEVVPRHVAPPEIRATGEFTGTCPASATLMTLSLSGPAKHR